ncbi:abc transporter substrate-binding protein : Ferrichrome-binding periplasmic protein OS=Paenibacillus sp. JCM 10914 GN=JCM10914_1917 PE=4 SV=1: Peripla_BP_2 [Gemmataceae bacterium]|nr:abc transporter substrate-binding protein : Ferrichrome-binding periplasmic protein OS=Paenibacillus sp. JCM 10914 GN=JCM10914_1917 PE=4 SV=1: Peripla_BP_2 [Gemmataceae bacterium]VTT99606.1 abc transporter substrate-binding protein : Ferrichrome-binding periplasmic protein OS=Paenibacillus sp. JCM 10914 GN=JCM10914_1917 PE=4 SV=1: Peripla_BP_2 [Gemmataceae bacterium]
MTFPRFSSPPGPDRSGLVRAGRWAACVVAGVGLFGLAVRVAGVADLVPDKTALVTKDVPGAGDRPVEVVEEGEGYRVVRHAGGTTRVPARPERICALAAADELLAIGVKPVAHSISDGHFPDYLAEPFADVPWVPTVYGASLPNLEAVVAERPDLIITRNTDRQTYLQLSRIAPTVVLLDHLVYYRERVLDVGTVVGRRREAEARVAWYNAKVEAANAALHPVVGAKTMAMMRVRPRAYRLHGDQNHVSPLLYGDLKMTRPDLVRNRSWSSTMSPEQMMTFDADYLILSVDSAADARRTYDELNTHPVWARVPAVRNGNVLVLAKWRHWSDAGILGRARGIDDVLQLVCPDAIGPVNAAADRVLRERLP